MLELGPGCCPSTAHMSSRDRCLLRDFQRKKPLCVGSRLWLYILAVARDWWHQGSKLALRTCFNWSQGDPPTQEGQHKSPDLSWTLLAHSECYSRTVGEPRVWFLLLGLYQEAHGDGATVSEPQQLGIVQLQTSAETQYEAGPQTAKPVRATSLRRLGSGTWGRQLTPSSRASFWNARLIS